MKVSNRQLLNSIEPLAILGQLKLPVKLSFKLAKVSRKVDANNQDYRTTLNSLHKEYSKKDENGKMVVVEQKISFEDPEAFDKAFDELLNCENELDVDTIKLSDFRDTEIEPHVLYHLDWLIEE